MLITHGHGDILSDIMVDPLAELKALCEEFLLTVEVNNTLKILFPIDSKGQRQCSWQCL